MSPLVCIVGPTAAGKSHAALALALRHPIEIVSVDSALVYRGMDIGTAKPSQIEQSTVPHHLIDLLEPSERYSAAQFVKDAIAETAAIRQRGRIPVLVGGTMLYFKALREGLADLPAADPAIRGALEAEAASLGWPALHRRLAGIDPATALRLDPHDAQRIQRALEVWHISGRTLSSHFTRTEPQPNSPGFVYLSLEPSDRARLHARIAERFAQMLAAGLIEEVQHLRARGDLHADLPSMRSVGYRQVWQVLEGTTSRAGLLEAGIAATRQLAKRQLTWLRALPERYRIDCLAPDYEEQICALAAPFLIAP